MNLFHRCRPEPVAVSPAASTPLFGPPAASPATVVLFRCPGCGSVSTQTHNGRWTLEQIRGERAEPAAENEAAAEIRLPANERIET